MEYERLPQKLQEYLDQLTKAIKSGKVSSYLHLAVNVKSTKIFEETFKAIDEEALEIAKKKICNRSRISMSAKQGK